MPFDSEKQRRYLWANKPEVAKQIAYKQHGGPADSWWNRRMAGVPQHTGYIDDPDNIAETVLEQDPYGGKYLKDSIQRPGHYVDQATYYIPKHRPVVDEDAARALHNAKLKAKAQEIGFKFQEGGSVPMDHGDVKKVTQKDRYGNQISYEFESPVKPLDQTAIVKEIISQGGEADSVSIGVPEMDHPGEPRGTDTVPAWLTPGEFVVNAEAMRIPGAQETVEAINDQGRAMQQSQGGSIPHHPDVVKDNQMHSAHLLQMGGQVPFLAGPRLNEPQYQDDGGWITDELLDRLAEVESGSLGTKAVSPAGAIGKYQWLPSSAKQAGYGVKAFDPLDDDAARKATAQYLKNMQKYHGFTPEETLRAYNWGPGNVLKHKKGTRKDIPDEALNYPGKILGFDKVEGVPAPAGMPVPTARPEGLGIPEALPTPRPQPEPELSGWQQFANKYLLGDKTKYSMDGGPVYYQAGNIVPEIKPGGHVMFGGDQNLGGQVINDPIEENAIAATQEPEGKWWHNLLGQKSKSNLGLQLDPNEARLYHEANPSLVGDDPIAAPLDSDVEGTGDVKKEAITNVPGESLVGQVDDFGNPKKETDAEIVGSADADSAFKDDVQKKILNKIDETVKTNPNATGPGSDQKGANATEEEIVNAAEKDPSLIDKAGGFLKSAFGELFDGKELARAAILYAGSRALGFSHDGSIQYVAKGYLNRVDAKQTAKIEAAATKDKRAFELAKTDKFTPASVSAYKKSGNPADLVSKKSTAGAVPTGVTEQRLLNGKKTSVQQVKTANGSIAYMLPNGKVVTKATLENNSKPYDASFDKGTSEYRTRRSRAVKSNTNLFKEIQGREDAYRTDDETKYNTDIIPSQAAQDFWTFAESYGIDPESDEAQDLMGAAYRQAIAQSSIEGAPRAKNLKPFLEAAYIRQETGAPELFQVNPDKDVKDNAKFVRSDKMQGLTSTLDGIAERVLPKATKTDARNQIIGALVTDWGQLSDKDKKQWNARANKGQETGFFLFAKEKSDNWLINNKIGE